MKIVFIEPRASKANVYSKLHMPLLGPVYLGTILKNRGHAVEVYNENIQAPDYAGLKADLIGISILTPTARRGYEIARRFPKDKVIMGGVHASLLPGEALEYARQVVVGEAEDVIVDVVEGKRREPVVQGRAVEDLDALPNPDFSLIQGYRSPSLITPISTSRGCPFDCSFCSVTKMFGRKYRFRSAENIIVEMKSRNTKQFFICDDNFAAHPERTRALLGLMYKTKIRHWVCQVRADVTKDGELMDLMSRAGCSVVCVGFESVNPKTLASFQKRQTVEEIVKAIRSFRKKKIKIHGMFVLGGEDDNKNTVWETLKFANKQKIDTMQLTILTPFPGTKVYEDLEAQKRIFTKDWSLYDAQHVVFKPKLLSAAELQVNVIRAYAKFYSLSKSIILLFRLRLRNAMFRFIGYLIVKEWVSLNCGKHGLSYVSPPQKSVCAGLALFFFLVMGSGCASSQKTTVITPEITNKILLAKTIGPASPKVTEPAAPKTTEPTAAPPASGAAPQEFIFPKDFLWGAGTSSHQVEGNNTNNDWWQWEQQLASEMRSGQACDGWNRFEEDFKISQNLGLTAYRFSLEWSRIEPSPGQFDTAALDHYRKMIFSLRSKGIEPIVTLNHFTIPLWLVSQGGWLSDKSPELFSLYVRKAIETLGKDVHYWITINEPAVYTYKSYMIGQWPPGKKSTKEAFQAVKNLARAHALAYGKIKEAYAQQGWKEPMIGIAQQVLIFSPCSASLWDKLSAKLRDQMINHLFIEALIKGKARVFGVFSIKLPKAKTLDFIGLNYYTREYVRNRGFLLPDILGVECALESAGSRKNSLGWEIYPQGLYAFIKDFSKYKLPILISENGICTNNDDERSEFIVEHLRAVALAMKDGVPVIGYLYWSLLDNYEWAEGFAPRFGLVEVDYATQKRKIRGSARKYQEIIKSGKLIF